MKQGRTMSPFQEKVYRFCRNKISLLGLMIVIGIIIVIFFGEAITPYE